VVVVVAGAWVVVVVAGAWVVVVVAGAWVVVVVAGAWVDVCGCLLTLVAVVTSCRDLTPGSVTLEAPRTVEDVTVAPSLLELTVAPELLLIANELTSPANAIATIIPPAKVRRRRIGEAP
jgi:hypothetical protein